MENVQILQGWNEKAQEVVTAELTLSSREVSFIKWVFEREVEELQERENLNDSWGEEAQSLLEKFQEIDAAITREEQQILDKKKRDKLS
jgi:hypothetical protein